MLDKCLMDVVPSLSFPQAKRVGNLGFRTSRNDGWLPIPVEG